MEDDGGTAAVTQPTKESHSSEMRQEAQQRRMVTKYDRAELEDLYLRTYDENITLKKHTRKQEDKIKRMATKLLRLVNDQKKANKSGQPLVHNFANDRIEELQDKLRDAEKQNSQLKEKLSVQRVALATNKRPSSVQFGYVKSRIDTGHHTTPEINMNVNKNLRVVGPKKQGRPVTEKIVKPTTTSKTDDMPRPSSPKRKASVQDDIALDARRDEFIHQLENELHMWKGEVERLTEDMRQREEDYQESLLQLKQKLAVDQRTSIQENIDVIRLQREAKDKSNKLSDLQEKYMLLDENLRTVKQSHDTLILEMEYVNRQLKDEQNRVLMLHNRLKNDSHNERHILEFNEKIMELQKENVILKESNEKLVTSAFDMDREREWKQKETRYRTQIAQLEATLKADLGEKGSIIDKLTSQRVDHDSQSNEFHEMKIKYNEMKLKHDDMQEKINLFSKGTGVDFTEIEEALVLVHDRKQKPTPKPGFLHKYDDENDKDGKKRLLELEAEYAETIHELEKTRKLLVMQHKINKDYQMEVKAVTDKMEEMRIEYDMKLDEYAHLLDIRAARIKKLEAQLRDVAYGTRQYKIDKMDTPLEDDAMSMDETVTLERGQNLFEIHVTKVLLSEDAVKAIGDNEPSLFCTWEFFEYEIQSTPVIRSANPKFDFTSQYVVKVDDFFLHYIQKETCTLELHQAFGQDYQTIAACQISFRELFEKSHGRLHGEMNLTGVIEYAKGINFGSLQYWIRLKVPMEQALRRYKERTKALGYISTNLTQTSQLLHALDEKASQRPSDNVNELYVSIIRCLGVKPRRHDVQPSPYCMYQFYDFNDHDTAIIPNTNNPEFNDYHAYPVPMTFELDNYLKNMPLKIFVFDDQDPVESAYLGIADIPLISLVHDKPIKGNFQLTQANGETNGTIEVSLSWQYSYLPPIASTRTREQMSAAPTEPPEKLSPSSQEETHSEEMKPTPTSRFPHRSPKATSTPMVKSDNNQLDSPKRIPKPRTAKSLYKDMKLEPQTSDTILKQAVRDTVAGAIPDASNTTVSSGEVRDDLELEDIIHNENVRNRTPVRESSNETITPDVRAESSSHPLSIGQLVTQEDSAKQTDDVRHTDVSEQFDEGERVTPTPEVSSYSAIGEDTMFGDTGEENEEIEENLPQTIIESDSEGVVVETDKNNMTLLPGNSVTIVISYLTFEPDAAVLSNPEVEQFFIEYRFLDFPAQELETPFALPKPATPGEQLVFNFSRTFPVDLERNYGKRQLLASMLLPGDPTEGNIQFTVVSEPTEDDINAECSDVGIATVNLKQILEIRKDIVDQDIPVYSVDDTSTIIGHLNVSINSLLALIAVEQEIQIENSIA